MGLQNTWRTGLQEGHYCVKGTRQKQLCCRKWSHFIKSCPLFFFFCPNAACNCMQCRLPPHYLTFLVFVFVPGLPRTYFLDYRTRWRRMEVDYIRRKPLITVEVGGEGFLIPQCRMWVFVIPRALQGSSVNSHTIQTKHRKHHQETFCMPETPSSLWSHSTSCFHE